MVGDCASSFRDRWNLIGLRRHAKLKVPRTSLSFCSSTIRANGSRCRAMRTLLAPMISHRRRARSLYALSPRAAVCHPSNAVAAVWARTRPVRETDGTPSQAEKSRLRCNVSRRTSRPARSAPCIWKPFFASSSPTVIMSDPTVRACGTLQTLLGTSTPARRALKMHFSSTNLEAS